MFEVHWVDVNGMDHWVFYNTAWEAIGACRGLHLGGLEYRLLDNTVWSEA